MTKSNSKPIKRTNLLPTLESKTDWTICFQSETHPKMVSTIPYREVLTDSNYLICKVGTNFTEILHRNRIRPIIPQNPIDYIADIDPKNFVTDPQLRRYRSKKYYFDEGLPTLLENEKDQVPPPATTNFDSSVRVSISFGRTLQPPGIATAPAMAGLAAVLPENSGTNPMVAPRWVLTPPEHLTAQILDPLEETNEFGEPFLKLWRPARLQNQDQNRYRNFNFFEAAGQQLWKTQWTKRTSQGERKEKSFFHWPPQYSPQGTPADGICTTNRRTTRWIQHKETTPLYQCNWRWHTANIGIVQEVLFSRNWSMRHCVSSDFHMEGAIAAKVNELYSQIEQKASINLIPGSVLAYYDKDWRRWIYTLVRIFKFFHKPLYGSLTIALFWCKITPNTTTSTIFVYQHLNVDLTIFNGK